MKTSGMDSRVPAQDRAYAMILVLLDGVIFTREQLQEIKRRTSTGKQPLCRLQRRVGELPCKGGA